MFKYNMFNWIFDLDYTLYQMNHKDEKFDYGKLDFDPNLKLKIQMLPGRKLMFTNANVWHTVKCVKILSLEKTFHKVVCRELSGFKPNPSSFLNFIHITKINNHNNCFFFEDTISNLEMAKKMFGWQTVYIGGRSNDLNYARKNPHIINYVFSDITEALQYFQHQLPSIAIN